MYNDQLEERQVEISSVFLDPNNPRFWSEQTKISNEVPDSKVPEDVHQLRAFDRIKNHGLEELKNSILRNGFLPLDRIVVRELVGLSGSYVVIEGNRRLAALKWLRRRNRTGDYFRRKNHRRIPGIIVWKDEFHRSVSIPRRRDKRHCMDTSRNTAHRRN